MTATPPSGQRPGKEEQSSRSDDPGRKRSRPSESLAADARWLGWGLLAIVLTWGGFQLQLPLKLLAVPAGLAGVAVGTFMVIRAVRTKAGAMLLLSGVFTALSCGLFGVSAGAQALFWEATSEFEACTDRAVTDRALNQCQQEYEDAILRPFPGTGG